MFTSIIQGVVGLVAKPLQEWQKRKTLKQEQLFELDKLEQNIKLTALETKLQMAKDGQNNNFTLDQLSMQEMKNSYKDEFVLIVFIAPMILAFTPYSQMALDGFKIVALMPDWYVGLIIGMVVVIYGMRGLLKDFINKKFTFKKEK